MKADDIVYCSRCEGFVRGDQLQHHEDARADICDLCLAEVNEKLGRGGIFCLHCGWNNGFHSKHHNPKLYEECKAGVAAILMRAV